MRLIERISPESPTSAAKQLFMSTAISSLEDKTDAIIANWKEYYQEEKSARNNIPAKVDSPFGYETWKWAEEYLKDIDSVRLEKDDNMRTIDVYGRYLIYAFIYKKGKIYNYNLECVRTGHSPYFNKYGNSRRFHQDFVDAQEYAQKNKLGIWSSDCKCYPDYGERILWWNKRAEQIMNYEEKYDKKIENYINLLNDEEYNRLSDYVNKEVVIFGGIGDVMKSRFPFIIRFPHSRGESLDLVIFEENAGLIDNLELDKLREYYVYAKGKLTTHNGRFQIVLTNKEQLWQE